jgi:hypothetical protein
VSGYSRDCRNDIGGIKTIDLVEIGAKSTLTYASGAVTSLTLSSGKKFYTFELTTATCTASDDIKSNAANGSLYYEHKLNMLIPKRSASFSYYLKNLAQNDLMAIITTNHETPQYWLLGAANGLKMQDSTSSFGTQFADFSGYNLQFLGMEPTMALSLTSGQVTTLRTPA